MMILNKDKDKPIWSELLVLPSLQRAQIVPEN